MSEVGYTDVKARASSLFSAPSVLRYTGIELIVSQDTAYFSGNQDGFVLSVSCPWGNQAMADAILGIVGTLDYRPYSASDVVLPPEMQLGDGVEINGEYFGIYKKSLIFDAAMAADISAPDDQEIDHEYPFTPPKDRQIKREINRVSATLRVDIDRISAAVESTEGSIAELFVELDEISARVENVSGAQALLSARVDQQGAAISAVVTDGHADGRLIIEAINGTSAATISADRINLNAQKIIATGVLTWSNIDDTEDVMVAGERDTERYITRITENTITTEYLYALGIEAQTIRGDTVILKDDSNRDAGWMALSGATSATYAVELASDGALRLVASSGAWYLQSSYGSLGSYRRGSGTNLITCNTHFSSNGDGDYSCGTAYYRWSDVYAVDGEISTSDRRLKKDVDYSMQHAIQLILETKPCTFTRMGGRRTHYGMISQDVESQLDAMGLSSDDFAGFIKSPMEDDEGGFRYSLRYQEYIAPMIYTIQRLWERVERLERYH